MIISESKMETLIEGLTPADAKLPAHEVANMRVLLNNQAKDLETQVS